MSLLKKVCVLTLVMIALVIPVMAISDNAAGEVWISRSSVEVTSGFNDRSAGTIMFTVDNDGEDDELVTVSVINRIDTNVVYTVQDILVPAGSKLYEVYITFRTDSVGTHQAKVVLTSENDVVHPVKGEMGFSFTVDRSIWSNITTYIIIIVIIVIIAIAVFLKMRGAPKAEKTHSFTAMEEERKASKKRSSTEREEYKGRKKK
ncbi:MAG: hypothetical protein LBV13_03260 [Methanomassiliicoccaceae archaeon]|jgi:hypothetical protein|nr:hypothetical protein [Methanomassiliicoccaceae archaeon]